MAKSNIVYVIIMMSTMLVSCGNKKVNVQDVFDDDQTRWGRNAEQIEQKKESSAKNIDQSNFGYIAENEDNSDDISARDDAHEYNFVGKIKGKADQYPFKMALNINEEGKVSGYYIVTDGDSERVLLKGSVTNWPDKHEGQISLFEFDEAKNDYTGLYFQGDLTIEYSQSGSFAGYSINNGRYKNAADIDLPFTAESM